MGPVFEKRTSTRSLHEAAEDVPRAAVSELQRGRMLRAAIDAVAEVGYARMTVAQVITRARVSRKTFYEEFEDREDCFLAVFAQVVDNARELVRVAYESEPAWRDAIRAALARVLELIEEEPVLARLCVVEALGAGEHVLAHRAGVLDEAAAAIDRGRTLAPPGRRPPELTAEALVGGVFAVLYARILREPSEPLGDLLAPLMSMIVMPYLGSRAATRELSRRAPARRRRSPPKARLRSREPDPLDGLNMRLTYRTLEVLAVIGADPGASNRQIATRSGIADQGQISKLLNRLARLELVENRGVGQDGGGANAWHLTAKGARLERATRSH
jgi:AcrR family transcriptional regulator/DNA-binding MarR family transcriptional regulator